MTKGILTGHKHLDGPGWEIEDDTGVIAWVRTKKEAKAIVDLQQLPAIKAAKGDA